MGIFSCKHDKLGPVKSDGIQYCLACNKAFNVGKPPCPHSKMRPVGTDGFQCCQDCGAAFKPAEPAPAPRSHVIEVVSEHGIWHGSANQSMVTQRCKLCGKMFGYNKTCGKYPEDDPSDSKCFI